MPKFSGRRNRTKPKKTNTPPHESKYDGFLTLGESRYKTKKTGKKPRQDKPEITIVSRKKWNKMRAQEIRWRRQMRTKRSPTQLIGK